MQSTNSGTMSVTMPPRPPAADTPHPDPARPESTARSAGGSSTQPEATSTEQSGLGLSAPQVAGSALASVTAALAASWLGVAGTIIGAALGSLFATVGAALYAQTIRNSKVAVAKIVPTRPSTPGSMPRGGRTNGTGLTNEVGPDEVPQGDQQTEEFEMVRAQQAGLMDRLRALKWKRIAAGSAVVLVIALGAITAVEQLTGSSVSRYTGGNDNEGTTIGRVFDRSSTTSDDDSQTPSDQSTPNQPDQFDSTTTPDPTSDSTSDSTDPDDDSSDQTEPSVEPEPTTSVEPTTPSEPDPGAQEPLTPTSPTSPDDELQQSAQQATPTTPAM